MAENKKNISIYEWIAYGFLLLGTISLILAIVVFLKDGVISSSFSIDLDKASNVGDFFSGAIGIFWSIAGVLLLFATLTSQREEFSNTQSMIHKQNFENAFYQMLKMILEIKHFSSKEIGGNGIKSGDELFQIICDEFKGIYDHSFDDKPMLKEDLEEIYKKIRNGNEINTYEKTVIKDHLNSCYVTLHEKFHSQLGHYLRYIHNTINFVLDEWTEEETREKYIKLIQAQMNDSELTILFYNAISEKGKSSSKEQIFYDNIDTYGLLENIDSDALVKREHHILYPNTKFKLLNVSEKDQRNRVFEENTD